MFYWAYRFTSDLLITQYSQNQTQRFVPLGVTVYRNPPAFDLTEFGIWNFDVQRQFGNPDLHLQLGPQVTVREVQQHSDPSSHLLAIHVDVITPVWYLRAEKRMSVMEKWEKNSGLIFSGHISELHITKINTMHLNKRQGIFEMDWQWSLTILENNLFWRVSLSVRSSCSGISIFLSYGLKQRIDLNNHLHRFRSQLNIPRLNISGCIFILAPTISQQSCSLKSCSHLFWTLYWFLPKAKSSTGSIIFNRVLQMPKIKTATVIWR